MQREKAFWQLGGEGEKKMGQRTARQENHKTRGFAIPSTPKQNTTKTPLYLSISTSSTEPEILSLKSHLVVTQLHPEGIYPDGNH